MKPTAEVIDIAAQAIEAARIRGQWRRARYEEDRRALAEELTRLRSLPETPQVRDSLAISSAISKTTHPTVLHYLLRAVQLIPNEPEETRPGTPPDRKPQLDSILQATGGFLSHEERSAKASGFIDNGRGTKALIRWCIGLIGSSRPSLADALADCAAELFAEYQGSAEQIIDEQKGAAGK